MILQNQNNAEIATVWNAVRVAGGRPPRTKPRFNNPAARRSWDLVAEKMQQQGVDREMLGKVSKLSPAAISRWSNYERPPKMEKLVEVAKYFHLSLNELLGIDPPTPSLQGLRRLSKTEEAVLELYKSDKHFRGLANRLLVLKKEEKDAAS